MAKRKRSDPCFVTVEMCATKHDALVRAVQELSSDVQLIRTSLVGEDLRSGLVKEFQDYKALCNMQFLEIKSKLKGSLSGKDKAIIVASLITAVSSIIIAFIKWFA